MTPHEKGKALEGAVAAVEGAILRSVPAYAENTYRIECRKLVSVGGVTHEIDVWVEIDLGKGYRSLFIFECKNWATPVGKNEVIVLSEKIEALGAQKGYLVAREVTADAKAQALKDVRVELTYASDMQFEALSDLLGDFHTVGIEQQSAELEFIARASGLPREELVPGLTKATLGGELLDLDDFVNRWVLDLVGKATSRWRPDRQASGIHPLDARDVRYYAEREMILDGQDIIEVHLAATLLLHVARPRIVSAFDIHSRGRAIVLEPIVIPGGNATLSMTVARV